MDRLKVLIVDDEPPAREGLRLLLARDAQVELVGQCANGQQAVAAIRALQPDLLLLDVQMPEMDGFAVLEQVGVAAMPLVIFVTAYDRYALRAFEVQALDYLLKPFTDERFDKVLQRAKTQLAQSPPREWRQRLDGLLPHPQALPAAADDAQRLERLLIKSGGRVSFLRVAEIDWIEAADYYVILHVGSRTHLLRETIAHLEARLDAQQFLRIHRSTIVNLSCVRSWQPQATGEAVVTLRDGTQLQCSRRRRKALEQAIR
jgi:two-component system LytT family response regulator